MTIYAEAKSGDRDIDLLKCRSFVVVHQFTDDEVLSPDFGQTVMEVIRAARPLVYWYALFPSSTLCPDAVNWAEPA
jgi:uncharacterized protein (DUF2461 family)